MISTAIRCNMAATFHWHNDRAVPQLNSEALTSQTAQVDTVSGATYTSTDYRNSLQSAIDAARAAGLTAIA